MSIKENIVVELNKIIDREERYLNQREMLNVEMKLDNYDTLAERNFICELREFIKSI